MLAERRQERKKNNETFPSLSNCSAYNILTEQYSTTLTIKISIKTAIEIDENIKILENFCPDY